MNRKFLPLLIALFLVFLLWKGYEYTKEEPPQVERKYIGPGNDKDKTTEGGDKVTNTIDRNIKKIFITKHARCRMECRHVDEFEIKEILKDGKINYNKSRPSKKGGYEYALEGRSSDNQNLRIVFAQEDNELVVVTCIDLDTEWECHCPGDEHKN